MIVGVDNESQILNEYYANDERVRKSLIKKTLLDLAAQEKFKQFTEMINRSIIICVYGISLGIKDSNF